MAQFEREMMLERRRSIAKAKVRGRCKGRKPTARAKAQGALRLLRRAKRSLISRLSWESGAEAFTRT